MKQVKEVNIEDGSFIANGTEYLIENKIAVGRYADFQKLEFMVGFQAGFYGAFENMKSAYNSLNAGKYADAAVMLHNTMTGVNNIENRLDACIMMAALFLNTKDEDRTTIDEAMVAKKRHDWEAEGIDITFFLRFAASAVHGFIPIYREIFQTTLKKQMEKVESDILTHMQGPLKDTGQSL